MQHDGSAFVLDQKQWAWKVSHNHPKNIICLKDESEALISLQYFLNPNGRLHF